MDASADAGEGDRVDAVLGSNLQRPSIAGRQETRFTPGAAMPDWTDGVDDVPGRQAVARGDLGVAGLASLKPPAFFKQLRSCRPVDGPVYTSTKEFDPFLMLDAFDSRTPGTP